MGGAAVSSADTGAFSSGIELNAIQRSNPEMQNVLLMPSVDW
jgi:phosphoribosylformylglycinamidine synthase